MLAMLARESSIDQVPISGYFYRDRDSGHLPTTTMPQGKAVSADLQWTIVRLSTAMSDEDVGMYTDVSERKVREILAHFKKNGDIKLSKRERGRVHRRLCDADIQVRRSLFNCIHNSDCTNMNIEQHLYKTLSSMPDLYLDELRLELQEQHGVSVSTSTIWRTLVKGGYSMKKVSQLNTLVDYTIHS